MKRMTEAAFNALSDDELENMDMSEVEIVPEAEEKENVSAGSEEKDVSDLEDDQDDSETLEEESEEDDSEEEEKDKKVAEKSDGEEASPEDDDEEEEEDPKKGEKDDKPLEGEAARYKEFFDALSKPFKANGIDMVLKTPEEWVSMAQKGANYTQKMQSLAPNLKMLRMLENHNLLDEGKLSFLIDLEKRDPAAIQKFLKDADIDPMSVDTDAESTYEGKSHAVSDQEHLFATTVADVANSGTSGKSLIREINAGWDSKSKDIMFNNPEILPVLAQQKDSGVYDTIMNEVKRRQALGQITGMPVLTAYKNVGEELTNSGQLQNTGATNGNNGNTPSQNSAPKTEVKTRTRKRKSLSEDPRVTAAAPSRSGGVRSKPKQDFNPLALSDEEFEKQFG